MNINYKEGDFVRVTYGIEKIELVRKLIKINDGWNTFKEPDGTINEIPYSILEKWYPNID